MLWSPLPTFIEGRNGNCSVKTTQLETHKRALGALQEQGIYPKYARMDANIQGVTDYFDSQQDAVSFRANQSVLT